MLSYCVIRVLLVMCYAFCTVERQNKSSKRRTGQIGKFQRILNFTSISIEKSLTDT